LKVCEDLTKLPSLI